MQRTRGDALREFMGLVNEDGDSRARLRATFLLDRLLELMWQATTWVDFQSPVPIELTLVPGRASYALPDYYGRPGLGRVRNLTRGGTLDPRTAAQLDDELPTHSTSRATPGVPRFYVLGGIVGVFAQPDAAGEVITAVSDANDDHDVSVSLEGDDADGRWRRQTVTLQGQTPVALGTWRYVDGVGKGGPLTDGRSSRGTVTLRTAGNVTIQVLYPEESAKEHRVVTFAPVPIAADVIALPVLRRVKQLRRDSDMLPGDWWPALCAGMLAWWKLPPGQLGPSMWPELQRLIENNNLLQPRTRVRPYGGWAV